MVVVDGDGCLIGLMGAVGDSCFDVVSGNAG